MGDSKYGRLFTEQDVERLIAEALIRQHTQQKVRLAGMLEHLPDGELTFPADEPLFLLRGQDEAAPRAIADDIDGEADYLAASRAVGAGPDHLKAVEKAAHAMREWQLANPDRVKVPD